MTSDCRPVSVPFLEIRPRTPGLLAGGLALVAAASAMAALAMSTPLVDDQIRWSAIALGVLCIGLLLLMSVAASHDGTGLLTWRMGPWSLAWGAPAFGLATIGLLGPQAGPTADILPGSILQALRMIAMAMVTLTAGYCFGPYRLAARHAIRGTSILLTRHFTDEIRNSAVPWVLFAVGIAAQIAFAAVTGRFGYVGDATGGVSAASGYGQFLGIAAECVPMAVAAAAIQAYQTRYPKAWLNLITVTAAAIAAGGVSGLKGTFIVTILAVIIPYTTLRRRIPIGALAAAAAFFLLIVIPFNAAYRVAARGTVTLTASQAVATAPTIAGQVLSNDLSLSMLPQSADYLAQRLQTIDGPAIVAQRTPSEIPYLNPVQLATSPVIDLIPRIVWPGKPILAVGYQVSQEYFHLPSQVYTSSAITPEGDLYRHGGWLPLLTGMFLLGTGIRILDEVTDLRRSIHGAFLIIVLFETIVQAESDWATMLAGIPGQVLLWLAVISFSFTRRTRQRTYNALSPAPPPLAQNPLQSR